MATSDTVRECSARLMAARSRVVNEHPFFGLLLINMRFALDDECETACTNGTHIIFGIDFMNSIGDKSLDFVLLHETLHAALQHTFRREQRNHALFNVACDIVVNSIILDDCGGDVNAITVDGCGVSMHLAPNGEEGARYSAEEVYQMFIADGHAPDDTSFLGQIFVDDHSTWAEASQNAELADRWKGRLLAASDAFTSRFGDTGCIPDFARNYVLSVRSHEVDWRTALASFIEPANIHDYSWLHPDRRYIGLDFYLPMFEETDGGIKVKNLMFFVDVSGSMPDRIINGIMAEIRNAISTFDGKLQAEISFFNTEVSVPAAFSNEDEFNKIVPEGSGGTSFECIFDYIGKERADNPPAGIIILTDGYARFPQESAANGLRVLWIIVDGGPWKIDPPWGNVIHVDKRCF